MSRCTMPWSRHRERVFVGGPGAVTVSTQQACRDACEVAGLAIMRQYMLAYSMRTWEWR